ncbi:MMS19 nucleotide excision repair protein [Canna indica]|uniref:MMS19 nucleotide excision repair protein n=1 Tax=Canna indica TaxID=4628 RepID=A0AAQ3QME9_9LILI|nr:MMS19 nucleotide excision repair protein [Canna indica]
MKLLLPALAILILLFVVTPSASLSVPLNCSDTTRLCTSFLAFKADRNVTLPQIQSMFDVFREDVTADEGSSPGYVFVRKNCSCLSDKTYLTNTTFTVREETSSVYPEVARAYRGLAFLPNMTRRAARPRAVVSLHLLCGCSSGLWNYLMTYVMENGDSIESLSSRFGVSMDSIETVNGMSGPDGVVVGDVYYIPLNSVPGLPYVDTGISPSPAPALSTASISLSGNSAHHSARFPYGWVFGSMGVSLVLIVLALFSFISFKSFNSRSQTKDPNHSAPHKFRILQNTSFCYASGRYLCCNIGNMKSSTGDAGSHNVNIPKGVVEDALDMEKPVVFKHEEVLSSTDNFSDSNLLGHGKYGSVYYGVLRDQEVAIKRMTALKTKEFMAEMKVLCKVHHASLVELIGYAATGDELFLIYEYAEKGSLESHLHDPQNKGQTSLSWISRVQIALDAARGLEYIHEHTKNHYVHRDIKTSNILLDGSFRAKISDFGLAKLVVTTADAEASTTKVVGTFGYLAPEYMRDGLATTKSDVYAFGVVLFELISGKEAITRTGVILSNPERRSLASIMLAALRNAPNSMSMESLKEYIDPYLMNLYPHDCVYKMAMLAKQCVDEDPVLRLDMKQVVISLSQILLSSIEWEATLAGNSQVFSGLVHGRKPLCLSPLQNPLQNPAPLHFLCFAACNQMEKPSSWIPHVEAFVNSARSSNQLVASVDAIAALVKNDLLTLEALVREMEQYLTTSDNVLRARGLLLLAEVLNRLLDKPLDSSTVSTLAEFFIAKLEDWQTLHGALIGCLALLKRAKKIGMVESNDARKLAECFFSNVQVQSLAVRDRKLCFEVLQCLLDVYPEAVVQLGDDLVYRICEAIDEEKDPRCLMLTFYLIETLGRLFPDPSGPMASFCEDIFDILSRYFPIYFTHPKDEGLDIKREDLSKALMHAFSSSPFFEPFVIPLLLEKLSSSLPSAKLDSLKYLNSCLCHYGADRMAKHAKVIWYNLKDVIFNFAPQRPSLLTSGLDGDMESEVNQIANEALSCLQTAVLYLDFPDQDSFLCLVIDDEDITTKFCSLTSIRSYSCISTEVLRELSALGSMLSILSKTSTFCCTKVFQKSFPDIMEILGVSKKDTSKFCAIDHKVVSDGLNFGVLYLSVELITSCRELTLVSMEIAPEVILEPTSWYFMLKSISGDLCSALGSVLQTVKNSLDVNGKEEHITCAVKGLQVLATFPELYSPISEVIFEDILVMLMSIITSTSEESFLWKFSLKTLVQIGLWIENVHDAVKGIYYSKVVIQRIISILQTNDSTISLSLKLVALSEIGKVDLYSSRIIQALQDAIITNLTACIEGDVLSSENLVPLLECYSTRVLPRCCTGGNFNEIAVQFAVSIWDQMEKAPVFKSDITMQDLLDQVMKAMKLLVAGCTVENQYLILQKAYSIFSSMDFMKTESMPFTSSQLDGSSTQDANVLSYRDEWVISLFGSVVISLHPQTPLIDVKIILNMFMVLLLKGNVPAAQALASIVNKWPANIKEAEVSTTYSLDRAIEEILMSCLDRDICFNKSVVLGVAWVGKGLLMRGHEKVKEIALFLLKCLVHGQNVDVAPLQQHENGNCGELPSSLLATFAADAFEVILSDSDDCLNKTFNATVRPLYKQRFFSIMSPILLSSIKESDSLSKKVALYRALGHVISNTPLAAVVAEAKMIIPALVNALAMLSLDNLNKDMIYSLLLVLSGILMDDNGKATIVENIHIIVDRLIKLISYPHLMIVRETAIQCLVAMSGLPYARIYPFRSQVLRAVSTALDDKKRTVRKEAVRCRQAWASIASRSLQF